MRSPLPAVARRGAKSQNKKNGFYFAILVAAAGDRTRKGTLTVPFHTILPSDTCDRAGSLTGRNPPALRGAERGVFLGVLLTGTGPRPE